MVKFLSIFVSVFLFMSCDKRQEVLQVVSDSTCYKGKLVLVGICGNAVVQVLDDRMPPSFYEATWKDESTGITYQKVMGNANYCTFPANLKENEEFYFRVNPPSTLPSDCVNCKALSPTPQTRQYIQICVDGK
jgi:hypothetical protein